MTSFNSIAKSIELIRQHQANTGAYIASPAYIHYGYSWLRDGTFIAYAMDCAREHDSALRYYEWCKEIVLRYELKARNVIAQVTTKETVPGANEFLHTRYTVDGEEVAGEWGNFQLDGYGAWLWGICQHMKLTGRFELASSFRQAMELTVDYLTACWALPNYDCWEEFGDLVHPATLAAIYGGLHAVAAYLPERSEQIEQVCKEIKQFVMTYGVVDGHFIKSIGRRDIDSSLLWVSLPFALVDVDDPIMKKTVRLIEQELHQAGGVHRYSQDTYYGGGQWILLTAWLGWYYVKTGEREKAQEILTWIERKYTKAGLPEQVQDHLLSPKDYPLWVKQAGEPANPLLWSHAMYMVLVAELALIQ
ncbi:glycoside hydrolase family 15 protein [Brevibacillus ginsengisoli]|uniref:glycoside hydrolase family 15 protein n=1 Tax=Brevibacillus ginsengisoli TaxID=363854 RepID=UPI003CF4C7EE